MHFYVRLIGIASLKDLKGFLWRLLRLLIELPFIQPAINLLFKIQPMAIGLMDLTQSQVSLRNMFLITRCHRCKGTLEYDHSSNGALHNDEKTGDIWFAYWASITKQKLIDRCTYGRKFCEKASNAVRTSSLGELSVQCWRLLIRDNTAPNKKSAGHRS